MSRIEADHLAHEAIVYVRQSTIDQVINNVESRRRQYGLVERARPFSRVLRLKSPAGLSPQNSVSRTKRWRGRSRGVTFAKLSAEERFAVSG